MSRVGGLGVVSLMGGLEGRVSCVFCELLASGRALERRGSLVLASCPVCGDPLLLIWDHRTYASCRESVLMVLTAGRVYPGRKAEFTNSCCPGHAALHLRARG